MLINSVTSFSEYICATIVSESFLKFFQAETQEPSTPQSSSVPSDREETNNDVLSTPNIPNVFSGEFHANIAV